MVIKCPYDWSHWTILCIWQHHLLDFYYLQSNIMICVNTLCEGKTKSVQITNGATPRRALLMCLHSQLQETFHQD